MTEAEIKETIAAAAPAKRKALRRAEPEGDMDRVLRALQVSGRRLVERRDGWRLVTSGGDGRMPPLMRVHADVVEKLKADRRITEMPNGYVLAMQEEDFLNPPPAAGKWVFGASNATALRMPGRSFLGMAAQARQGRGPLTLRQALAGLRLIEDAEQAARDALLTMNWDAVPTDRQVRSGRDGGFAAPTRRAAQRIERIRKALGERDFSIVYAACVQRMLFGALEHRFGLRRLGARTVLPRTLEKVAEVYDG
jgi:hypothetical protein